MHIFISYAKADAREIAKQVFTRLNTLEDVTAWMDTSLVPAESWAQQIQEELNRSDLVLVIITPDVNRPKSERQSSSFVLKEINYAQSLHKPVLPVMGNYTHLPVQIADLEYIDFSNSLEDGMNRLVEYILNITKTDPLPQQSSSSVLEPWQEVTIDTSTRRVTAPNMDAAPPFDWTPPPVKQSRQRRKNPLVGLLSGVLGGCLMGGVVLSVTIVALYVFVLNDDNNALSDADADATATAEAEITESVTPTRTPTRTSVPLVSDTPRPFVPSRTPTDRPFVPTNTHVPPTNTVVFATPTFIPTNTYVAPTSTWVFVTQPPVFVTSLPPTFTSN